MPLDPFFDERLRVHRKHLIDKALSAMRARLATLGRFWHAPALPATAAAVSETVTSDGAATLAGAVHVTVAPEPPNVPTLAVQV